MRVIAAGPPGVQTPRPGSNSASAGSRRTAASAQATTRSPPAFSPSSISPSSAGTAGCWYQMIRQTEPMVLRHVPTHVYFHPKKCEFCFNRRRQDLYHVPRSSAAKTCSGIHDPLSLRRLRRRVFAPLSSVLHRVSSLGKLALSRRHEPFTSIYRRGLNSVTLEVSPGVRNAPLLVPMMEHAQLRHGFCSRRSTDDAARR